jgi:hypothetical protein
MVRACCEAPRSAPPEPVFSMKDAPMTIRELRSALATMHPDSPVQVVLFKHDGTSEVFALEEAYANNGHAQLEIYEPEPPESPSGS